MKLEALQGFLRVNPQNTVNKVDLQGRRERKIKRRESALARKRRRAAIQEARMERRAAMRSMPMLAMRPQMNVDRAEKLRREVSEARIKNAVGNMSMQVGDILNAIESRENPTEFILNAPGARQARKAARRFKRRQRQQKRTDRRNRRQARKKSRGIARGERQITRQAKRQARLERRERRKQMTGAERRADRRKQRQDKRAERQKQRQDARQARKDKRRDARLARQESRQQAKLDRKQARLDKREGGVLKEFFSTAGETVSNIFGGDDQGGGSGGGGFFSDAVDRFEDATGIDVPFNDQETETRDKALGGQEDTGISKLILPLAIGGAALLFLTNKNKKKTKRRK